MQAPKGLVRAVGTVSNRQISHYNASLELVCVAKST